MQNPAKGATTTPFKGGLKQGPFQRPPLFKLKSGPLDAKTPGPSFGGPYEKIYL